MMRGLLVVIASLCAVALHLAAFAAVAPLLRGAAASGDAGVALMTLAPADPVLVALVAEWDRPPDVAPSAAAPPAVPPPVLPTSAAVLPDLPVVAPAALPPPAGATVAGMQPPAPSMPDGAPRLDTPPPAPSVAPLPPEATASPSARPDPDPAPQTKASPATPAQKAAGTGNGKAAGQNGAANAATADTGSSAAKAEWGAAIRARIERRKAYPSDAKGVAGKVILRLVVGANGQLLSASVARSSGHSALDRAALKAVKSAGRFPKAPKGQSDTSFSLPVSFSP